MRPLSLTVIALFFLPFLIHAQTLPTIDFFTVDNDALDYARVEAGYESANFSWQAVGLRSGDKMEMHAWVGGDWVLIGEGFEPAKTDSLVIAHPLGFELPRYRLSIVDSAAQRIVESILELHYATPSNLPNIDYFLPRGVYSLPPEAILNDEGVAIHWRVSQRWYRSNIYFEQVLPDGRVIAIAENNADEWRRATDQGLLFPEYPGDGQDVVLRLRVVNIDTDETLAQYDRVLPIIRSDVPAPELVSFSVTPNVGRLNGTVTLSWEVANAYRVFIGQRTPIRTNVAMCKKNGGYAADIIYEDLPPSGTLEVQIPEEAYAPIRFQIVADRYLTGDYSCEPSPVLGEIQLELEEYSRYSPILEVLDFTDATDAVAGDTFHLSWSAREGQSVIITQRSGWNMSFENDEAVVVTSDLPLTGSMDIQIPDTIEIRQEPEFNVSIQLERGDGSDPEILWSHQFRIDRDDNLDCDSFIEAAPYFVAPMDVIELTWDSCGTDETVLETLMRDINEISTILSTEAREITQSGSEQITLPDQQGVMVFVLYRILDGERIELDRTSVQITN